MAGGTSEQLVGILNDSKNTNQGNTVSTSIWSEAVIPAEVGLTSYWVDSHNERRNDETMRLQLDLLDEVRATAE